MEKVLDVYEKKYNNKMPVICFDERPYQLIEDVIMPIPMKNKKVTKQDYEYKRNGTCCVFMTIEPLKGKRFIEIKEKK